jgi:2-isopropylmalate synthase
LAIAHKLDELGVTVIEAGFPVNSPDEFEAVRRIAAECSATVCGIGRVVPADLEACVKAGVGLVDAICSTSDIQMEKSQHTTREEAVAASRDAVRLIKDAGIQCMYTPMDATRTDPAFLVEICQMAAAEGADWIGLTDTVGVGTPESIAEMVSMMVKAVDIPVSIHCHDDFGLAVANTLAGVNAGAKMVQVCVNGLGERAGNAALEEVVVALQCLYDRKTSVVTEKLLETSRMVERLSGVAMSPNKSVVGRNAFTHESGIHSAGIMRDRATFEPGIITPEMVGQRRRLVVGKHAGRHGIKQALAEAGLNPSDSELTEIVQRVRAAGAKGKQVMSADLFAIAETVMQKVPADLRSLVLDQLVVTSGDKIVPTASVQATVFGKQRLVAQTGVGPVDAAFGAIKAMLDRQMRMEVAEYHVDAITGGSSATVRVSVTLEDQNGHSASASAANVDIVMASVDALITAANHLLRINGNAEEKAAIL